MEARSSSVAFVTGASRGIGRILATALASDGVQVVGFARAGGDLASLSSVNVAPIALDVTEPMVVEVAFADAVSLAGPPDLVITCAGSVEALGPVAEADPSAWWRAVEVDLRGTMLCARAGLASMLPRRYGRVVTVYGNLGDDGRANLSAFAVAKAGVARFTEILATELAGTGVTAVCLHPGFVRSSMTEHLAYSDDGRRFLASFGERAERHWGDGAAAIDMIRRIASGEADQLAGRVLHVGDDLRAVGRTGTNADSRRLRVNEW